jgi:hypothetical protein
MSHVHPLVHVLPPDVWMLVLSYYPESPSPERRRIALALLPSLAAVVASQMTLSWAFSDRERLQIVGEAWVRSPELPRATPPKAAAEVPGARVESRIVPEFPPEFPEEADDWSLNTSPLGKPFRPLRRKLKSSARAIGKTQRAQRRDRDNWRPRFADPDVWSDSDADEERDDERLAALFAHPEYFYECYHCGGWHRY